MKDRGPLRMGRFRISQDIVEHRPDAVLKIMARIIVVRCEHRYDARAFEYTAISDMFEEVEEGYVVSWYHFDTHEITNEDGSKDFWLECKPGKYGEYNHIEEGKANHDEG